MTRWVLQEPKSTRLGTGSESCFGGWWGGKVVSWPRLAPKQRSSFRRAFHLLWYPFPGSLRVFPAGCGELLAV